MTQFKKINNEVFYTQDSITQINQEDISFLKDNITMNKTKIMSIPFFFEPSYDFKMDKSFLTSAKQTKNNGLIYEKFLSSSLKKFIEYHR